jgi:hypothetical protein
MPQASDSRAGAKAPNQSNDHLDAVRTRAVAEIQGRYGIKVVVMDVPAPFTGDLDGVQIVVDYALPSDESLFVTVHLFGHTVQWNTDAEARAIGLSQVSIGNVPSETLAHHARYEQAAARYSLQLLHDIGELSLDAWLSAFSAADTAYLMHYYQTGEKLPWRDFWRDDGPVLAPMAIPPFSPRTWTSRSGVVI